LIINITFNFEKIKLIKVLTVGTRNEY